MALFDTYTLSWLKIARIKIYWKLPHQLYVLNLLDMSEDIVNSQFSAETFKVY